MTARVSLHDARVQWLAGGGVLVLAAGLLASISHRFQYDIDLTQKPVLWVAAGLCAAGMVYAACLPKLVARAHDRQGSSTAAVTLAIMIGAGLAARLILFASEPVLENDFYRYLWDGAVTSSGQNPFAVVPADVASAAARSPEAAPILDRIGHADLRTIYPPVAQAAFAAAHQLAPWNLKAWRSVLLLCDLTTLALLLRLLKDAGRAPLWAALYWWNPLVIFSLFNGAHMDVIVLPPLLLSLLWAGRGRTLMASASLAVAAGAKIWPILLLPLILRPAVGAFSRWLAALGVTLALLAVQAWPILAAGLDDTSGFMAYAQSWQRNSALFPIVEAALSPIVGGKWAGSASRALLALICAAVALAVAWRPYTQTSDLLVRAATVVATLLLLAPAQYPWYFVWLAPFLPFVPLTGLLVMTATLPIYYTAFYFAPRQQIGLYNDVAVFVAWAPVWLLLVRDVWHRRSRLIA